MTMITDITPDNLRCSYGGCPSVHRCTFGASCPSVISDGKGGLVVIGKIAAGLATQMTRADGRLLSETIAADETAVLIGEEYFSGLPELASLREDIARYVERDAQMLARIEELETVCVSAYDQLRLLAKDPQTNPWCKELAAVLKDNAWKKRFEEAARIEELEGSSVHVLEDGRLLIVGEAIKDGDFVWFKEGEPSAHVGPNEAAVVISADLLSELPEMVRLRRELEITKQALSESEATEHKLRDKIAQMRALYVLSEGKSSSPQAEEKA